MKVTYLKTLLITALLAVLTSILIISIDFFMGSKPSILIWKVIYPFRVMEPAEYVIMFFFVIYFIVKAVRTIVKKKKGKTASSS